MNEALRELKKMALAILVIIGQAVLILFLLWLGVWGYHLFYCLLP